jgi:ribosomal protein S27AE
MRPRLRDTAIRFCDKCGSNTEHSEHKAGFYRDGTQRTRWVCLPCHNLYNKEHHG